MAALVGRAPFRFVVVRVFFDRVSAAEEVGHVYLAGELKRVRALASLERLEVENEPLQLERQVLRETPQFHRARRVGQNTAKTALVLVIALQALDGEKRAKRVAQTKGFGFFPSVS